MRNVRPVPKTTARLTCETLEAREVPATLLGLGGTNSLLHFDSATPNTTTPIIITSLNGGETVLGIDFRPADGLLDAITGQNHLLTINPTSGVITLVSVLAADPADATAPFTTLAGSDFGFDFNPTNDRLRITSDANENLLVNPNNGLVTTQTDLNPGTPDVVGSAYTNSFVGAGSTGNVSATVTVTGGTATAGTDFTGGPYTVAFADGATTATLNIPITNDTAVEPSETVILTLSAPTNAAVLGAQTTTTLTITDVPPTVPPVVATTSLVAAGPVVVIAVNGTLTPITPFSGFLGSVSTATGDVNGDSVADVVVGAGINGHVKVLDGTTGAEIRSFFSFAGFSGGTYVGSGDIDGDGRADIIVGASTNGHVKVFSGVNGAEIRSFLAYLNFNGGISVASGDIDGDGRADIIVGASTNGHVKVFSGVNGAEIRSFLAYLNFNGGISVASGDIDGDGRADIVTGSDANGHVKVFSGVDGAEIRSFLAFPGSVTPTRIASRSVNADAFADLIVGGGVGAAARVRTFDGLSLAVLSDVAASDPLGLGVFVG